MFRGSNAYEQKAKRAVPQAPVSLCGRPVVFVNEPAKNVLTMDALQWGSGDGPFAGHGYLKIDATMRTLSVVVADTLTKYSYLIGITANPVGEWVTQQARNLSFALAEQAHPRKFLIRDRDTKFSTSFDEVFRTEGVRIIRTPLQSPRANAFAERFVGTVRRECLDRMLVFHRRQLETVLSEFVDHYNEHRPHRSLGQQAPLTVGKKPLRISYPDPGQLRRSDKLGGLIHEYRLVA